MVCVQYVHIYLPIYNLVNALLFIYAYIDRRRGKA
jgi:hypothetical protein